MLRSEIDLNIYIFMSNLVNAPVFVCFFFFSAEPGNPKVIYISLGATLAILLLSIPVFAWCYRRTKLKNVKRFM